MEKIYKWILDFVGRGRSRKLVREANLYLTTLEMRLKQTSVYISELKKDLADPLHRWLLFLEAKLPDDQLEELMEMDPVIKKTEERLAQLNADDYTRELYEARENARIEFNSKMHSSWEEGYENGVEQGKKRCSN